MKRGFATLIAVLAAGQAAAQSAAPDAKPPATPPAQQAPEPRRALALELDENARREIMSGSRSQERPRDKDALPSLGGDATRVDPSTLRGDRSSPFPKQSDGGPASR